MVTVTQCVPSLLSRWPCSLLPGGIQAETSWGNPEMSQGKIFLALTLTKMEKKRSALSSCTLLEAIFLSLQWSACFWTASFSILMGELAPGKVTRDNDYAPSCSTASPWQPPPRCPAPRPC